jgi:hypothetical protein
MYDHLLIWYVQIVPLNELFIWIERLIINFIFHFTNWKFQQTIQFYYLSCIFKATFSHTPSPLAFK